MKATLILATCVCMLSGLSSGTVGAEEPETTGGESGSADKVRHISGHVGRDEALVREKPDTIRWLEANGERFPVMETLSDRADSRGAVVVLTDAGQSPAAGLGGALHPVLSALGWHVMSLGLPALPLPERADRADGAPGEGGTADADAPGVAGKVNSITIDLAAPEASDDEARRFGTRARGRVAAAMAALRERPPGPQVFVGIGLGASPLTRLLAENAAAGGNTALVWIAPRFDAPAVGDPASWLGDERRWPILDIVDRGVPQPQARDRKIALEQMQGAASYRQDALTMFPNGSDEADRLGRRLHSWAVRQFEAGADD